MQEAQGLQDTRDIVELACFLTSETESLAAQGAVVLAWETRHHNDDDVHQLENVHQQLICNVTEITMVMVSGYMVLCQLGCVWKYLPCKSNDFTWPNAICSQWNHPPCRHRS